MKLRTCGDRALLVEVATIDAVLGLYAALREHPPSGVTELVPAERTLLVRFDPLLTDVGTLARQVTRTEPVPTGTAGGEHVTVPVIYDGPDLAAVAERSGLSVAGVVAAHTAGRYVVAFSGFAPGFGYLTGLDPVLHLPRRAVPRTRVPAGAVAVAGAYTGIYPRHSPGGWQLLGRTEISLWDSGNQQPARLTPGTSVRFEAVSTC